MSERLVLPDGISELDIAASAGLRRWKPYYLHPSNPDYHERVWATADERTKISYVEDFGLGLRYLVVRGLQAEDIRSDLRSSLPIVSREELRSQARVASTADDWIRTVHLAGALSDQEFDPETFEIFKMAFEHPDPQVRQQAIYACSYAGWPELRQPIEGIRMHDTDPKVARFAEMVLAAFDRHSGVK